MKDIYILITDIWQLAKEGWHSVFRWPMLLLLLWLFRVTAMPADTAGLAKGLQVITILGLLYYTTRLFGTGLFDPYKRGNMAMKWMIAYLILGLLSTSWSYLPQFSFFLSFEKIVLLAFLFSIFTLVDDFRTLERGMLLSLAGLMLFEALAWRYGAGLTIVSHSLTNGSSGAILFSYCIGEYLNDSTSDDERKRLLRSIAMISILILIISTSGGANASAAFGAAVAFLISKNIVWAIILMIVGSVLFLEQDIFSQLIHFLMPGKSETELTTATGRTAIWELIEKYGKQKPLLGWGYATIERYISDKDFPLIDAHNNWYGAYGGTGWVGLCLLVIHQCSLIWASFKERYRMGYAGLLSAVCCATLNGYSYGFLSGKACSTTIFYFVLMIAVIRFAELQDAND